MGFVSGVSGPGAAWRQGSYALARVHLARRAQPEVPVEPVAPVTAVGGERPGPVQAAPIAALPTEGALNDTGELLARMRISYPAGQEFDPEKFWNGNAARDPYGVTKADGARCETCARRKYQDGSDDPGVSFKTPTRLTPEQAQSAVRGHEQEHVVRERAEAEREGREVVSQSVRLKTGICPECGRVYISGGVTETVTRAAAESGTEEPAALPGAERAAA